jgi:hypothetical protein
MGAPLVEIAKIRATLFRLIGFWLKAYRSNARCVYRSPQSYEPSRLLATQLLFGPAVDSAIGGIHDVSGDTYVNEVCPPARIFGLWKNEPS